MSRSLMAGLLAAGCLTAAAAGSYIAVRQNAAPPPAPASTIAPSPVPSPGTPVHETEALIEAPAAEPAAPTPVEPKATPRPVEPRRRLVPKPDRARPAVPQNVVRASHESAATPDEDTATADRRDARPPAASTAVEPPLAAEPAVETAAEWQPVEPSFTEVVIPASAVVGLQIENTVTSERARIEDRVEARITRDVFADGRLVLPAGSRVTGAVTLVERGGKVKERARLGVRFHTVVLANGRQVPLRTEAIYREGESPAAESSRKIGGAAIGGAVLGAIFGGGKGAIAGATAGAAGGTAAVMSGDRNPAILASGSIVTVKLAAPVYLDVER